MTRRGGGGGGGSGNTRHQHLSRPSTARAVAVAAPPSTPRANAARKLFFPGRANINLPASYRCCC